MSKDIYGHCFFDIETESNEEALEFLPEPQAPGNYKDPEKIAAYVAEKRQAQIEKAALDYDYGKITAVSVRLGLCGKTTGWLVNDQRSERDLLKTLWSCFAKMEGRVCGYNILGFDIPYVMRRSFALRLPVPLFLDQRRYSNHPTLDLMQVLANWSREDYKSLKFICARYGIENPLPDLEGSQYAEMSPEVKLAYVKNDVDLTCALYERMLGYYQL